MNIDPLIMLLNPDPNGVWAMRIIRILATHGPCTTDDLIRHGLPNHKRAEFALDRLNRLGIARRAIHGPQATYTLDTARWAEFVGEMSGWGNKRLEVRRETA